MDAISQLISQSQLHLVARQPNCISVYLFVILNHQLVTHPFDQPKIKYIKELSKAIESRKLRMRSLSILKDEEVIEQLTQVKGIGRWTAEMFLIFSLGRMDVLPVGDLGLRKGVQRYNSADELPNTAEIEKLAERWRPYRTVATWYLWKSLKTFDTIG